MKIQAVLFTFMEICGIIGYHNILIFDNRNMRCVFMKKIAVFLLILVLCTQLFSCNSSNLPLTSDNFSQEFVDTFLDNYRLVDPQLAYVTASPWEVEIKVNNDEKLYLSLIDTVDKAYFVSVTERVDYYMGAPSYEVFVYQTSTAPIPMKDWTIKSIRVLEVTPIAETKENALSFSERYMEALLSSSTVLHTYDNDNGSDFLDMIKSAYSTAETLPSHPGIIRGTDSNQPNYLRYYSLLVEFNECDNIIWHTYLFEYSDNSDNIYFECTTYDTDDVNRYGFSMAKISDEFVDEIRGLIEAS